MANLIPASEAASFKKVLEDHFDTFKRSITVHKSPVRSITNIQNSPHAGYGEDSEEANVAFIPQNKNFEAVVVYEAKQGEVASQVGTYEIGLIKIKVKSDAANYIKEGKTEKIELDGKSFNKVTEDKIQNFLGSVYYIFYLQATT